MRQFPMSERIENPPSSNHDQFAQTQLYGPNDALSRQAEDIALAAELLRSGILNDRQIAAAVSDWSIHGSVALAEHIREKEILKPEQLARLLQGASARVSRARQRIAQGSEAPASESSVLIATLEQLDGSGQVAKLLGVTVANRSGEQETRVMEGRYELIRKLGQGGLGRVWFARDVNLNRYVALKEISHAASASDAILERFKNEAEITGRLDHPSIVPIYQLGKDTSNGRLFYTMRFLGRSTLQDSINEYHERREAGDDDPMLLRHLVMAFVNVCHAVGHAHSRRVIHRDLKPENVVIDSFGQVIVIDWGLAKIIDDMHVECLVDSSKIGSVDQTMEGQVLGTPLYMAPEQAAGRLDELDYRTDIFGLGAMLFAIITGCAPHERTQTEAATSGTGTRGMISVIASGSVPNAREVNSDVDPALEAICRKAMSRRRYARYQQAIDLAEDVQRWMAGETVSALKETGWQVVNRWIGTHPRLSQTLLAIVMITLVAVTTLSMSARHNRLVVKHARYNQMLNDVRQVELELRDIAMELSKDIRFLAALPPIQGIIEEREGAGEESEEVWLERLQTIFNAMLRSNSDYLALSFEAREGEGAVDVVRVERNVMDRTLIRIVPTSRLMQIDTEALMATVASLDPGDVKLTLDTRTRYADRLSSIERLSVATPVYSDVNGECFGMLVIEADISSRVIDVLRSRGTSESEIYIADGAGELWFSGDPINGIRVAGEGETIPDLPESIAEKLGNPGESLSVRSDNEYVVKRFYVDPTGRGITIFSRMIPDDR